MKYFFYTLSLLFFTSCSTGLIVYDLKPTANTIAQHEPFAVFEVDDEIKIEEFQKLGAFEYKDAGLTLNCDYSTVIQLAKEKARSIGANGIKVTEHKYPDALSTCDRIKGYFLFSDDMWKYEDEITWFEKRKLTFRDFRDPSENEGVIGQTMSGFNVDFKTIPLKGQVQLNVRTIFRPEESYISSDDTSLLLIQQLHFNASELYARKYIERTLDECKNLASLNAKYQNIYNDVQTELRRFQRDISNNAYRNIEGRNRLLTTVEEELKKLDGYSKDSYLIAM